MNTQKLRICEDCKGTGHNINGGWCIYCDGDGNFGYEKESNNMKITINTKNAAFEYQAGIEVARILRGLADKIENWEGKNSFTLGLLDVNGNKVGEVKA